MSAHLRVESVPIIAWNRCPSSRGTRKLVAIALAARMARTVWALIKTGESFEVKAA